MKAAVLLRNNISALLKDRGLSQHDLAQWCHHSDVWVSYILTGTRQLKMKDFDRIADFFGIATYQLFQPGLTQGTERRSGRERRKGADRRISHAQRNMISVASEINRLRPRRQHTDDIDRAASKLRLK